MKGVEQKKRFVFELIGKHEKDGDNTGIIKYLDTNVSLDHAWPGYRPPYN